MCGTFPIFCFWLPFRNCFRWWASFVCPYFLACHSRFLACQRSAIRVCVTAADYVPHRSSYPIFEQSLRATFALFAQNTVSVFRKTRGGRCALNRCELGHPALQDARLRVVREVFFLRYRARTRPVLKCTPRKPVSLLTLSTDRPGAEWCDWSKAPFRFFAEIIVDLLLQHMVPALHK